MPFNQQEQEIIQFGKEQGKNKQDIIEAISKFRLSPQQLPIQQSRFKETIQDIKQTGQNIVGRFKTGFQKVKDIKESDDSFLNKQLQRAGAGAGVLSQSVGDVITGATKAVLSQEQENELKENLSKTVVGGIKTLDTSKNILDQTSGRLGSFLAGKEFEPNTTGAVQAISEFSDTIKKEDPELARNLEAGFNMSMLALDIIGAKAGVQSVKAIVKFGKQVVKRTFDVTKSIAQRISNVRTAIAKPVSVGVVKKAKDITKQAVKFTDNPNITGTLDEIKGLVGLPESTPSVDLTFRAIKPRLAKTTNLRRVKAQMGLANESIVQNGFKPTNIREYADAIYETKKKVWNLIQSKLNTGQLAGQEIDLTEIAIKILDRADDAALLRTNPKAAKQLVEIAENLVKNGDTVDILTAERIKQFLNAELSDAFGTFDLSQQAKEAKKLITKEIGNQLDDKLADLPNDFRALKTEYGSLSSIEDDVLKRAIVFERQNPEGLADILTKTQAAAEIAFGSTKSRLQGIARLTIAKKLKEANDVNNLIKKAFENLFNKK